MTFAVPKYCIFIKYKVTLLQTYINLAILVRLCLQLFIEGLMSSLRYLCLLAYCGVQHTLCCVFDLFFFDSCTLCCQFLCIAHFWLPFRCSLMFIRSHVYILWFTFSNTFKLFGFPIFWLWTYLTKAIPGTGLTH